VAQRVGRNIALLFHDRGTRRGVIVQQHAPAALYSRERAGAHFAGGSVGPRASLDGWKISSPAGLFFKFQCLYSNIHIEQVHCVSVPTDV